MDSAEKALVVASGVGLLVEFKSKNKIRSYSIYLN